LKSQNKPEYAVCRLSVGNVWRNATPEFRLVTQVLFGETVRVIKVRNSRWTRVACTWDDQSGWMHTGQLHMISSREYERIRKDQHFNLELIYGIISDNQSIPISIGASLYGFDGINARMPFGRFQFSGQVYSPESGNLNESLLLKIANRFLHAPEMKGGRSILGVDAGGFIQLLYKFVGIKLPREAIDQATMGSDIGFVEEARAGDLAFFTKKDNLICHVGMVTGVNSVIHVHGRVKIDKLDQQGIFDLDIRRYTYRLRTIRRIADL